MEIRKMEYAPFDIYTDGHGGLEPHFILLGEIEEIIE